MLRQPAAGVVSAAVSAEDLGAGDERARRVRSGVRSDVSIVCVDTITKSLLSSRVCNTVPVCCEVGTLSLSAERPVSLLFLSQ